MTHLALHSVYAQTAPAAPATPPWDGAAACDLLVIGAGYTGLSTALHAAERGLRVILLEAREPGSGAAGRNGGQVNPGLKHEPDEIEAHFGPALGARLVGMAGEAPRFVFDLVTRLGLQCEAQQSATVRAAYHPSSLPTLDAQVAQWARRGVVLERLDAAAVRRVTGSDHYVGATRDPRGGSVNPLAYARELARVAINAGARIAGHSPVTALARVGDGWRAHTPRGTVTAPYVVIATDGYSDELWPGLRTSFVPVYSSIVASAPLPQALRERVLAQGEVVYEAGRVTTYYRVDAAGRLLIGGRGVQRDVRGVADHRHLSDYALRLWPALRGIDWPHVWNGQFALTPDFYPRYHVPAPGVHIALGYSGRGVALATRFGAALAATVAGDDLHAVPLPVTPIPRLPMHRFWKLGVMAGVAWGRLQDRLGR
jgi:glycine/D-amino acid oxidase-like deaminating enzyme